MVGSEVGVQLFGNNAFGDFGYGSKDGDRSVTTKVIRLRGFRNGMDQSEFP